MTISVKVRYFASLRECMGRGEEEARREAGSSVLQLWQRLAAGQELPPGQEFLAAVNREHVGMQARLQDGDEVAFFPPVTGG